MSRMSDVPPELLNEMTPAVWAFVEVLLLQHAADIAELKERITELEAKLTKNSRNSSKPSSSEHPHAKLPPEKKLFIEYAKCRDGTIQHATLCRNLQPVRKNVEG